MSLKTWKREFYSEEAYLVSKRGAIAHSIKKWGGLFASVLKKHGVERDFAIISDGIDDLSITDDSCALCQHYINAACSACPLFIVRGNVQCDETRSREKLAPYQNFRQHGNPRPMILWLEKADAMVKAKKK